MLMTEWDRVFEYNWEKYSIFNKDKLRSYTNARR